MSHPQRVQLACAFLLHQRPYRDSSRIIELLTGEHGRVGLVARGVRRPRSAWKPVLQPFAPILVSWTGRGDLGTLTAAEPDGSAAQIASERLLCAWYMNELLLRLLQRHDPQRDIFAAYSRALVALASDASEARTLRLFEKRLLEALGYGLELELEAGSDTPIVAGLQYHYRLESGACRSQGGEGELTCRGATLLSLAREELHDERSLFEARSLLRAALALYLGDRPLHSRRVMLAVRRQGAGRSGANA